MTAGALGQGTTARRFALTIGGRNVTVGTSTAAGVPVGGDSTPVRISETSDGSPSQMTFTVEDHAGTFRWQFGEEVWLRDLRPPNVGRAIFGGWLVNARLRRRRSARGRFIDFTAVGWDVVLDWCIVPRWQSKADTSGRTFDLVEDWKMVQELVARHGKGGITAPAATDGTGTVEHSNLSMGPVGPLVRVTLREALSAVAEAATDLNEDATRYFYVDPTKRLHWFRGVEEGMGEAPYRIGEGSYTREVLGTTGLAGYWTLGEDQGAFCSGTGAHAERKGGYKPGLPGTVANERGYGATLLNGSTGYVQVGAASALHPGDTFTIEAWVWRTAMGSATIWSGGADDIEFGFSSTHTLKLRKQSSSDVWTTDGTFTRTSRPYHIVCTKSGSTRRIYVDGDLKDGSGTNATIVAGSTAPRIGARTAGDRFLEGSIGHVAVYSVALTAAQVLAHYRLGWTVAGEGHEHEEDAMTGREGVYVNGSNAAGSGQVGVGQIGGLVSRTAFGTAGPLRQEFITRKTTTAAARDRYAAAFLRQWSDPRASGSFTLSGLPELAGWRCGQKVYVDDAQLNTDGDTGYPVVELETDLNMGDGTATYRVQYGQPSRSGTRRLARRTRSAR